jgi:HD superfamily phosphodiesterase
LGDTRIQNLIPLSDNAFNIGTGLSKFKNIYAENFIGKASSSVIADKLSTPISITIDGNLSGNGARRETLENYIKRLEKLESIADSFKGVEKSFAIQAGREVRIVGKPEQISDADMTILARDVAKKVEEEMEYPGQIKVNIIRETRVVDYAK